MFKRLIWAPLLAILLLLFVATPAQGALKIGTDLYSIARAVCGYGDCLARGSWSADPYGWPNPGTLPVGIFPYLSKGVVLSQGEFFGNVGDTDFLIHSTTATAFWKPVVFQINYYKATGGGNIPDQAIPLRGSVNFNRITLGAAVDLDYFGAKGLSIGVNGGLPVLESKVNVDVVPLKIAGSRVKETRDMDLTFGAHYRAGQNEWFMIGAYMNIASYTDDATILNPSTFMYEHTITTSNVNNGRVGLSVLPAYGYADLINWTITKSDIASSSWIEMATEVRLGADYEHFNVTVPGEETTNEDIGYVGVDFRAIPDRFNPVSNHVRLYGIGGVTTEGGYSFGFGLYPNPDSPLAFLSINGAYTSQPIAPTFGDRVDIFAISISMMFGTK